MDGLARAVHGRVGGLNVRLDLVLEHVRDVHAALRLALRVANRGGVLLNLLEVTAGDDGVAHEAEEAAQP